MLNDTLPFTVDESVGAIPANGAAYRYITAALNSDNFALRVCAIILILIRVFGFAAYPVVVLSANIDVFNQYVLIVVTQKPQRYRLTILTISIQCADIANISISNVLIEYQQSLRL